MTLTSNITTSNLLENVSANVIAGLVPFDPTYIESLSWLDTGDATTITNAVGLVSNFVSKGVVDTFTAASGNEPTSGSRSINGVNVFDYVNKDLGKGGTFGGTEFFAESGAEFTVYATFKEDTDHNGRVIGFGSSTAANTTFSIDMKSNGNINVSLRGVQNEIIYPYDSTDGVVIMVRWDGTNAIARVNGGQDIALSVGTAAKESQQIFIGAANYGFSLHFNGVIGDCLSSNEALSLIDQNYIFTGLGKKYNLPYLFTQRAALLGGQSNAVRRFTQAESQFTTAMALYSDVYERVYVNGAASGIALLSANNAGNYWYNSDTAILDGTSWNNFLSALSTSPTVTDIIWDHGESDFIGVFFTSYEAGARAVFADINSRTGKDIYVTIPFGTSNNGSNAWDGTTQDESAQGIRDIYFDIIADTAYVKKGAERFDLPKADSVHLTAAGYQTLVGRDALILSGGSAGPEVSNVVRSSTTVTVTITHGDGTDFTPTTGIEGFYFTDDGAEIAISSAVRTNATTITLTLASAPTGTEILYYYYGDRGNGVTDANLVIDNSSLNMPLRAMKWSL